MAWSYPPGTGLHFTGAKPENKYPSTPTNGSAPEQTVLGFVNINTTSTTASLALYQGTSTTGTLIATIDCSSSSSRALQYMIRLSGPIYGVLTPAATGADVSVTVF